MAEIHGGTNYGLYGEARLGLNGNYGVYATTTETGANDFAGYFEGDTAVTGAMTIGTGVKDASAQLKISGDESDGTTKAAVVIVSPGQTMLIDGNEIDSDVTLHLNYNSAQDVDIAHGGGNVGIGAIANAGYKLYVAGKAYTTGNWGSSDRRLKTHIRTLENALDKVSLLRGVRFDWRADEFPERGLGHDPQIGVIAQEVEQVLPALVHTDDQGYKAVAYDKISAVLIEAVKELKTENEALRALVCQDHPEARLCQ